MVKRKDLTDIADKNYNERADEFMQCQDCLTEFGGIQGDFWDIGMDYALHCPQCNGENIAIVKSKRVITIIKE